jgi:two-component system OmpR family sensor kinase
LRQRAVLITVLFALIVTLVSVSAVFWEFYKLNKHQYIEHIFSKHETITQIYREHLQKKTSQIMLEANLAVYKFVIEEGEGEQKRILKKAKILKQKNCISEFSLLLLISFYPPSLLYPPINCS